MRDEVRKVTKSSEEEKSYAITLVHLQAAFFILPIGFLIAAAALLIEKASHQCGFYHDEKVMAEVSKHRNGNILTPGSNLDHELSSEYYRGHRHKTFSS